MIRDGILIHEDGSMEVWRPLPNGGALGVEYLSADLGEPSLDEARNSWAEADELNGLPALNPADAPIYRTRVVAEPISAADAEKYLAQIEQNREDAEGERAAEALEAWGEE